MTGRLKRRIVIAALVIGVVGLGGTALAASDSGGNSFLNDVAGRLGVSTQKLQSAINGANQDRLNQLVKQGKLTQAQANAIEKRMKAHGGAPFAGPFGGPMGGFRHHGFRGGPRASFGFGPMMGSLQTAASYLGLSVTTLGQDLRSGKTLATVATVQGKSVSGLEAALLAPVKAHLDAAVQAHRMSQAQETRFLNMISDGIDRFVTHGFGRFGGQPGGGGSGGGSGSGSGGGGVSAQTALGF
ncbi:MAG TPA: hypothetical protein VGL44_09740 [Gaiellales bacterium]